MKKFLCVFLATMILVSPIFVIAASATSSNNKQANQDKITDELKSEMETKKNKDYISIYVWLYDLGDDAVYSHLSNKKEKEINQDNEESYIKENVKNKVEKYNKKQKDKKNSNQKLAVSVFKEESEISEILTEQEIKNCIDEGKTPEQIIELSERYQYLSDYRDSRSNVNAALNDIFEKSLDKSKCKNVNMDLLLTYATMDCKKSYIYELSSMQMVKEIGVLQQEDNDVEIQESLISDASEIEETVTDEHIMQPIDTPYTGAGIKIGVLERDPYNRNADHLNNSNITDLIDLNTNSMSHATRVLSILCGKKKILNGIDYQGIAPNASIYFARAYYSSENITSLYWLIVEKNVSVINISKEISAGTNTYNDFECYIDCLVQQYRVSIVKSGGNNTQITTPGKAYNIITVGNMTNEADDVGKYLIHSSSPSYEGSECITNKPDICAFGTNVHMLYNGKKTNFTSGTSYAAPQVAGTIALMMEANPTLIGQPHKVKSILLTGADDEHISETISDNSLRCETLNFNANYLDSASPIIRNKTGAGILNIKASIENALYPITYSFAFVSNGSKMTNEIVIPSNMDFKVGLVFEKADHDLITDESPYSTNVNFEMIDVNTGNVVFSSVASETNSLSIYDNVKIFDVSTRAYGTYVFRVTCSGIDVSDSEGTTAPDVHEIAHDKINVALSFTCSCLNPIRGSDIQEYSEESNVKVNYCNSYGCFHVILTDITYYDELSWTEEFGTIYYTVTHKRSYSNEIIITDANLDYNIYLNDSTKRYRVRYMRGDTETVSYGYLEHYYFEIEIFDTMGNMECFETAVEVEYVNIFDRVYVYPIMLN